MDKGLLKSSHKTTWFSGHVALFAADASSLATIFAPSAPKATCKHFQKHFPSFLQLLLSVFWAQLFDTAALPALRLSCTITILDVCSDENAPKEFCRTSTLESPKMTAVGQQSHVRHYSSPDKHTSSNRGQQDSIPRCSPSVRTLHPRTQPSPTPSPELSTSQTSASSSVGMMYLAVRQHPGSSRYEHAPRMSSTVPTAMPELQHIASDALQNASGDPRRDSTLPKLSYDISTSTGQLSLRDEQQFTTPSPLCRPIIKPAIASRIDSGSHRSINPSASGELPPLQTESSKPEPSAQSLPSLRSALGDINRLPAEPASPSDHDLSSPHYSRAFSRSPPGSMPPPLNTMVETLSPPISPSNSFQHNPHSSPHFPPPSSIQFAMNPIQVPSATENSPLQINDAEYASQASSPPETVRSASDATSPGGFVCTFAGCNAHPFQTQYLLNSHANVHSSARPHYCPVKGCPRSEGGKGFKRKNEMIRHGLVHDSPGYVCPFCPDREHKYPRPDNLQRCVSCNKVFSCFEVTLLTWLKACPSTSCRQGQR